jgi:hypothetical protein
MNGKNRLLIAPHSAVFFFGVIRFELAEHFVLHDFLIHH